VKVAAPLANKSAILLLFLANTISGAAQGISMIAIPWYFVDRLQEPVVFSRFYSIFTLLSIVWVIYAGSLIDRFSRKHIFMTLTAVCGTVVLATSWWGFNTGTLGIFPALLVMGTTLLNFNLHYPTLYAFAQEMTSKANYARIVSWLEIQGQTTNVLSGALAALLLSGVEAGKNIHLMGIQTNLPFSIAAWELHEIFLIDGLTYVAAFVLIAFIRYRRQLAYQPDTGHALQRIARGYRYLLLQPKLLLFGIMSYGVFVTVLVQDRILLPEYVRVQLNAAADVFASSDMLFALGALCSGMLSRWLFGRLSPITAISILMIGLSGLYLYMGFNTSIGYLFVFSFIYGYVNTGVRIMRVTYLFHTVSNDMIGRLLSFFKVADTAMRGLFISLFSLSFFHHDNNIRYGYFVFGIFILLCGLMILPTIRTLNQQMQQAHAD
jgi:DHA3 family macrolide efflux protein-like MFS transporter